MPAVGRLWPSDDDGGGDGSDHHDVHGDGGDDDDVSAESLTSFAAPTMALAAD